ncbi:MAG: cupin domain-containing protein, partial [Alphaproteobacteria bacterium]
LPLYAEEAYPERISLVRFAPGAATSDHDHPGGEELFILDGELEDKYDTYVAGSWVRYPTGSRHVARSPSGCTLYVKKGHLPG